MSYNPVYFKAFFEEKGIDPESYLISVECDRLTDGRFANILLAAGPKQLHIISGPAIDKKDYSGYKTGRLRTRTKGLKTEEPADYNNFTFTSYELSDIESLSIVSLVASGLVVLKSGGKETALCSFTNGKTGMVSNFISLFAKLKEKGRLESEDFKNENEENCCPKCGLRYPEPDRKICPKCMKKRSIFVRLLAYSLRYKHYLILTIICMLLNSLIGLIPPFIQGTVLFDWALSKGGVFYGKIALVLLMLIACKLVSMLFGMFAGLINVRLSANSIKDIKSMVFSSMQRLSLSFFQKKQTGQLMTRVNDDATELQYFFVDGLPYILVNFLNIIGIAVIMLILNWKLTLLCFLPLPFVVLAMKFVFPKFNKMAWIRHLKSARMNSILSDSFKGTRVIKAFGREKSEIRRFNEANEAFCSIESTMQRKGFTIFPLLYVLTQVGGIVIWALGGWNVMYGTMTFGALMTFINYINMIYGPIQGMFNISDWWSYCMTAAQRIFEILDAVPEITEKENPVGIETMNGDIEVKDICFGYEPNNDVLKNVTLHAKPGQMVGIVGHSGAGKSTLVNLITRLYDVRSGEISIDGVNLKDLRIADLRKNIGIVSQEVYVFIGTIAENIAYAKPGCSREDVIRAAKIANAHDFICALPAGYDTIVGSGGHDLSGGEKQRISIARAILLNPKILILDEATASLDTETERQIQSALDALTRGRTTIAIAHRLSTLRNADLIAVMDNGKITESGSHAELIKNKEAYFRLYQKQFEALSLAGVD